MTKLKEEFETFKEDKITEFEDDDNAFKKFYDNYEESFTSVYQEVYRKHCQIRFVGEIHYPQWSIT